MFFQDETLQSEVEKMNWAGRSRDYSSDYLMLLDANLNSLKSDICIKRKIDYNVDLKADQPQAVLNLSYEHTCRARDWMTTNYNDWARVFVPADSWITQSSVPPEELRFGDELGKKVFGFPIYVPIGQIESITLKYNLPQALKNRPYSLLVQKQSGSGEVPIRVSVKEADGTVTEANEILAGDKEFSF